MYNFHIHCIKGQGMNIESSIFSWQVILGPGWVGILKLVQMYCPFLIFSIVLSLAIVENQDFVFNCTNILLCNIYFGLDVVTRFASLSYCLYCHKISNLQKYMYVQDIYLIFYFYLTITIIFSFNEEDG